jgi:hypothetical protein
MSERKLNPLLVSSVNYDHDVTAKLLFFSQILSKEFPSVECMLFILMYYFFNKKRIKNECVQYVK